MLFATRVHRTLTALIAILVPVAFANNINKGIYSLGAVCIFTYMAAGVMNAKKDNDYEISSYYRIFVFVLLVIAFLFSLGNIIVTITFFTWMILGGIYNYLARYYLFGDVTLLSITHHTIPTFSSAMVLGLDMKTSIAISVFMFITFWFIIHLKNLKDTEDDRNRGYKTMTTDIGNGLPNTKLCFELSFFCMFLAYFIFDLSQTYLIVFTAILLVKILVTYFIDLDAYTTALNFMRFMVIVFLFGLIIDKVSDPDILYLSMAIAILYVVFLLADLVDELRASAEAT